MLLPQSVLFCIRRLQAAQHRVYAVGGCVRDSLLGLTPHDYDLCTDATPAQLRQIFSDLPLVLNGEKHGTVGVNIDHMLYEITTFRTEGSYSDGRHPDCVEFVNDIKQDLARRDFTINAMAYSPVEGYIDPWGGREDLQNGILRAVGDPTLRFTEDALRIVRGVRFAVRFGLSVEEETEKAMQALAPSMDKLAKERIFDELCKLIVCINAEQLIRFAPVIAQLIPELKPCIGFAQHSPHHAYDIYTHTAHVVEATAAQLPLRWAALLHDIGKVPTYTSDENGRGHFYGHAQVSAQMADSILLRLKAPTALRKQVVTLIEQHMLPLDADKRVLTRRLSKYGEETVHALLALQKADAQSKGVVGTHADFAAVEALLQQLREENACLHIKDLAVDGNDLIVIGFSAGRGIGKCLDALLQQVLDGQLPNEKAALLRAALKYLEGSL